MNDLQIFNNPEFGSVRTVTIDGEPWFVGKDIAVALGYGSGKSLNNAIANHVDNEDKGVTEIVTPGGKQNMTIINESGLYAVIFGSKLESAKRFKHWVTSEVLPAIRKSGHYKMPEQLPQNSLSVQDYMELVKATSSLSNERFQFISKMSQYIDSRPEVKKPMEGQQLFEGIQDVFEFLRDDVVIENRATADVYLEYVSYCEDYHIQPVPKNIFSKCVRQLTDREIIIRRVNGKSTRVFK